MSLSGIATNVRQSTKTANSGSTYTVFSFEVGGVPVETTAFNIKTGSKKVFDGMPVSVVDEQKGKYTNKVVYDAPHGTATQAAPAAQQKSYTPRAAAPSASQDDDRQKSIRIQSARKDAAVIVAAMLTSESVAKTKRSDEQLVSLVGKITAALYKQEEDLRNNPTGDVAMPESIEEEASA